MNNVEDPSNNEPTSATDPATKLRNLRKKLRMYEAMEAKLNSGPPAPIEEDIVRGRIIEEVIYDYEDASVPESVAQEIFVNDGGIAHISPGPYNGFLQVGWLP